jgi:hypothetical protein
MTYASNVVSSTVSTTINAFYQTATSQLGTVSSTAAGLATDNSGCFKGTGAAGNPSTTAHSAVLFHSSGNTAMPDRIKFYSSGTYATDIAANSNILLMNIDFVLAATYQNSWLAESTRPSGAYCDKQIHLLGGSSTAAGEEDDNGQRRLDIVTKSGLNGLTKCTYFI